MSSIVQETAGVYEAVVASAEAEMDAALRFSMKQDRGKAQEAIDTRVTAELSEKVRCRHSPQSSRSSP